MQTHISKIKTHRRPFRAFVGNILAVTLVLGFLHGSPVVAESPSQESPATQSVSDAASSPENPFCKDLLVGRWQGERHLAEFRADGTWVLDPNSGSSTKGKWTIRGNAFIQDNTVYKLVALTTREFVIQDSKGTTYSYTRIGFPDQTAAASDRIQNQGNGAGSTSSLTCEKWIEKLHQKFPMSKFVGPQNPTGLPISPDNKPDFFETMGKPSKTIREGGLIHFLYDCSDGSVGISANAQMWDIRHAVHAIEIVSLPRD